MDERTTAVQRRRDDVFALHLGKQFVNRRLHRGYVGGIGTQQNALRQFIVLCLAEQVHRHPVGRCAAIGQDQNF